MIPFFGGGDPSQKKKKKKKTDTETKRTYIHAPIRIWIHGSRIRAVQDSMPVSPAVVGGQ
jgi:hypothetical protein